jgi:hypothetical protein
VTGVDARRVLNPVRHNLVGADMVHVLMRPQLTVGQGPLARRLSPKGMSLPEFGRQVGCFP